MISKEKLMAHVKPDGIGIEIGPGRAALPRPGANHDWIAAIHAVEYAPDLVAFLQGCAAALREGGILSLAISDRRYMTDHFRPLSGLGAVLDAHLRKETALPVGARIEALLSAVVKDGNPEWEAGRTGAYAPLNGFDLHKAKELLARAEDEPTTRRWCFTPISFLVLVSDLYELGLSRFRIAGFHPTGGSDFYVSLGLGHGKLIDGPERFKAIQEISKEQVQGDMLDFI